MATKRQARRQYTAELKREAVNLVTEQGYRISEAARNLGVNENLLRRWQKKIQAVESGECMSPDEREELKRLRTENQRLWMEREILKKAAAFFAKELVWPSSLTCFPGAWLAGQWRITCERS